MLDDVEARVLLLLRDPEADRRLDGGEGPEAEQEHEPEHHRYAARSAWIDRLLHGFMLFIVFNSMIVFESGAIRWAGVAMFAAFVLAWMLRGRFRFSANG